MRSDSAPTRLPELLAPAGSPEALEAAFCAGADAVYLGGSAFNARMSAHNFDSRELEAAVTYAHARGGRVYLTLNTLVYDRELPDAVRAAYGAAAAGVDGLIIADLGAAACIRRALPGLPLHASTQLSGHNAAMGRALAPHGFSRFVIARETRLCDLAAAVADGPLEVEVFVHGALCVCHSGQCLFSSLVGGRSGNRGECAQPCRLPYRDLRGRACYPLSLKDLSLAAHIPELIRAGVASLKIEGRMKSPAYVGGVTGIFRRLLDERRAADREELGFLAALFSRGGFTDGYFTGRIDHSMTGVRSEADKARSADAEKTAAARLNPARAPGWLPVGATLTLCAGQPAALTMTAPLFRQGSGTIPAAETEAATETATATATATATVTVTGDIPTAVAEPTAALTASGAERQLSRTGGTPYRLSAGGCTVVSDGGLTVPPAQLNALRRAALDALTDARLARMPDPSADSLPPEALDGVIAAASAAEPVPDGGASAEPVYTASFERPEQITAAAADFFSVRLLPLAAWTNAGRASGVALPPVIPDREAGDVRNALTAALRAGARDLLVGNPGHWELVRNALSDAGLTGQTDVRLYGCLRLNVTNRAAARMQALLCREITGLPLCGVILSPELTLPRLRDLCRSFPGSSAVVYGRIPLMLLEKCVIRELYPGSSDPHLSDGGAGASCAACRRGEAVLRDRTGAEFPVLRCAGHRNQVFNSLPVSMTDRADVLTRNGILNRHFLFTVESPTVVDRVIASARTGAPVGGEVRRIR